MDVLVLEVILQHVQFNMIQCQARYILVSSLIFIVHFLACNEQFVLLDSEIMKKKKKMSSKIYKNLS